MLKAILNKLTNNVPSNIISMPAAESTQGSAGGYGENMFWYNHVVSSI